MSDLNKINLNGIEYRIVDDETNDLQSQLSEITETIHGKNRWDGEHSAGFVSETDGVWHSGGSSYAGTSNYMDIINTPIVFSLRPWSTNQNPVLRYALYDENKTFLSGGKIGSTNLSDLTFIQSPDNPNTNCAYLVINVNNAKYMRFSMSAPFFTNQNLRIQIEQGQIPTTYAEYTSDRLVIKESALPDLEIPNVEYLESSAVGSQEMSNYASTLANGNTLSISENISIRKNKVYHLHALIDSSFDKLYFGHGEESYSLYFKIDEANVTFMTNGTESSSLAHGLTLSTYIDVLLIVGEKNTGTLILNTLNGSYTQQVSVVNGYKGQVFVRPSGCSLTDVTINFTSADMRQPIWMFGNSYFTHTSTARWTYYLIEWGFGRCLLNAYPGEKSAQALDQLEAYLNYATPKYVVWCLGMNDPDTGSAINSDWETAVESLREICEEKDIELILSTIPNVPSYSNYYKNEYVRNSGFRYIDFAKAVGAESVGSSWYTGCLSQDNTHPTADGARLLCLRAIQDIPELTLGNI